MNRFDFIQFLKDRGFLYNRILGGSEYKLRMPDTADFVHEFTFWKEKEFCFDYTAKMERCRNMLIPINTILCIPIMHR